MGQSQMGQMHPGGQILTSQSQTLAQKRWDNVSSRIKGMRPTGLRPNCSRPNAPQSKKFQSKTRRDKACPGPKDHKPKSQSPKFQRSKWPKSKQHQPKNRQSKVGCSPKSRVQKGHGTMSWQAKVRWSQIFPLLSKSLVSFYTKFMTLEKIVKWWMSRSEYCDFTKKTFSSNRNKSLITH